MLKNEIKIECSTNEKTGYKLVLIRVNGSSIILKDLSRFEIEYIHNRSNRVELVVLNRSYQGQNYDVVAVREVGGYEGENIVLKLAPDIKKLLIALLLSEVVG